MCFARFAPNFGPTLVRAAARIVRVIAMSVFLATTTTMFYAPEMAINNANLCRYILAMEPGVSIRQPQLAV